MLFMETARNELLDRVIAEKRQLDRVEQKAEFNIHKIKVFGKVNSEMPREVRNFNLFTRGL